MANGTFIYGGSVSVLLGLGEGSFGVRTDYATGGYVNWISVTEDGSDAFERGVVWTERPQQR